MRIIAFANQKGGCGKTTTTFHLGCGLAANERKTLLIDCDPQGHLSSLCGFGDQPSAETLLALFQDSPRAIHSLLRPIRPHLDLLPAHIVMSTLEQELASHPGAVELLAQAINRAWLPHQYVLIDCPPSLGFLTFNALRAANEVIIPIDASYFSLAGVKQLEELIHLLRDELDHRLIVHGLVTMIDRRTTFADHFLQEVKRQFPQGLYPIIIRHSVSLRESSRVRRPSFEFAPESNGAADVLALTRTVLNEEPRVERELEAVGSARRAIQVKVEAPQAQGVFLVGDFTGWLIRPEFQLQRLKEGTWTAQVNLPPGTYRYKFVIDGEWRRDPENPHAEPNPFGSEDSVLVIPG